jgi:hypothetical protein
MNKKYLQLLDEGWEQGSSSTFDDLGLKNRRSMPVATFSIRLLFRGFMIDPTIISKTLGLETLRLWRAGGRVPKLDGSPGRHRSPDSAWGWDASYYDKREDEVDHQRETASDVLGPRLDERLTAFLEPLLRQRVFVRELVATSTAAEIILSFPGQFYFGCDISPATLSAIADLGLGLGIEVFPDSAT